MNPYESPNEQTDPPKETPESEAPWTIKFATYGVMVAAVLLGLFTLIDLLFS